MPKEVVIKLDQPIRGHDRMIHEIKVREPSFAEYLQCGDPFVLAQAPGSGIPFVLENQLAIEAYTRSCIVYDGFDQLLLEQAGFQVARRIKEAILGFFPPRRRGERGLGRGLGDLADELAFDCGGSFDAVSRLAISELLYWHSRAVQRSQRKT